MTIVARVEFVDYISSITQALDVIDAGPSLSRQRLIIIKPNLTISSPPPVTTHVQATEAVCMYCRKHSDAKIIIGEGCGSGRTMDIYAALGYTELAEKYGMLQQAG